MLHPRTVDKPLAALVAKLSQKIAPVMIFASFIAAPPTIISILMIVIASALLAGNDQLFRTAIVAMAVSPLAELSKLISRRPRPETLYVESMRFKTFSFPSGHSYISALIFGFLAVAASSWQPYGWIIAIFLVMMILLVGISRVYLGAHFPSDVLAGWTLGGVMLYIISKVG